MALVRILFLLKVTLEALLLYIAQPWLPSEKALSNKAATEGHGPLSWLQRRHHPSFGSLCLSLGFSHYVVACAIL